MSQASSASSSAELNDFSSSRDLTYSIPPTIAHEILHRKIPLLKDIMAFSVGIITVKGLLHRRYLDLCAQSSEELPNEDSNSEMRRLYGSYRNPFSISPCTICGMQLQGLGNLFRDQDVISQLCKTPHIPRFCSSCCYPFLTLPFKICRYLVLIFTPGHRFRKDRRPIISCTYPQYLQRIRDSLAEMYNFGKLVSLMNGCHHSPRLGGSNRHHGTPTAYAGLDVFDESILISEFLGVVAQIRDLPEALKNEPLLGIQTIEHGYPDVYLQLLHDAENELAREMITPGEISPYMEGTVELSPKSCASGGWSEVYVGTYNAGGDSIRTSKVAIKLIRILGPRSKDKTQRLSKIIQAEIDVWVLAKHAHLLPLDGVHWIDGVPCLVSPWCGNGDIVHFVSRHEPSSQFVLALRLLREVLSGLEYLHTHTPTIVHCDLKGANILISDDGKALIADFGLARMHATVTETSFKAMSSSSPKGTYRWMAPELLFVDDAKPTTSSDIWSFACVVVETLTGQVPYHRLKEDQVYLAISKGRVPARPDDADDDLWAALQQCWRLIPADRPSARRLRDMIARPSSV